MESLRKKEFSDCSLPGFRNESGRCSKARVYKLENSRPKLGRMEETLEGGRGPPQAVAPLERERVFQGLTLCAVIVS